VPKTKQPKRSTIRQEIGLRDGLLRLCCIAGKLRTGEFTTATAEAKKRGLSRKTVQREINLLRSLGWKIEWDVMSNRYRLRSAPIPQII
jgi:predicted DNA-binding transcriptional regulator YafY